MQSRASDCQHSLLTYPPETHTGYRTAELFFSAKRKIKTKGKTAKQLPHQCLKRQTVKTEHHTGLVRNKKKKKTTSSMSKNNKYVKNEHQTGLVKNASFHLDWGPHSK